MNCVACAHMEAFDVESTDKLWDEQGRTLTEMADVKAPARQMQKPINVIHQFLTNNQRVSIWLINDNHIRFDGVILGYDEFMNVVLDDAHEVNTKTKSTTPVGRILLKGDTVGLMHVAAA